ncbi:MAG: hypothetical protein KAY54_09510 [Burkholderiaceae bacterium]|nr:hypothetical protein [Burkholderiaceae bacterium]
MKRHLTALFLALFAVLLFAPILAQAGECGVGGTAKNVAGIEVTKTDQEAKDQQARIGEDGFWWTCPRPKVEAPVLPKDCYPVQHEAFRTWAADGHACTTWRKYATSPRDPGRDRVIKENETDLWTQWTGPMRGQLIERCVAGERKVVGATCRPVTHCDHKWSTSSNGGKTAYVIDARGRNQVPVGQTAQAVAADGKTITVRCTVNGFTTR